MNKLPIISINGKFTDQVSVLDRGFAYGDGVFETCKLLNGKILRWNLHKDRLRLGCDTLKINLDFQQIDSQIQTFLAQIPTELLTQAVFKVTVTRGVGGRGYAALADSQSSIVLALYAASQYDESFYSQGVVTILCTQQLSRNSVLAGIKHLNRLEQVLARSEWQNPDIQEGILFDTDNHLIEGVSSNIFLMREGVLTTPDLSYSGVAGIMRQFVLETLAPQLKLSTKIEVLSLSDLYQADEIFICNSAWGIFPVRKIMAPSEINKPVGEITLQLINALRDSEIKSEANHG